MVMYKKCGHRDGDIIVILDDWCPKCKAYRMSQGQDAMVEGKIEIAQYPKVQCELCGMYLEPHQVKTLVTDIAEHQLCEQCYLGEVENPEHRIL